MILNPVAVAIQGLGFGPLLMALQGLLPVVMALPPAPEPAPDQGGGVMLAPSARSYRKRRITGQWTHMVGVDWFEKWLQKVKQTAPDIPVQIARSRKRREQELLFI